MIELDRLIADFEDCLGWPYQSPGSTGRDCSTSGIDCSGMFRRAYKLQGASIAHGSNTIWRKHLNRKGKISSVRDLQRGMAVFKHRDTDTAKYPDGQGDFFHIGLVTSVSPLAIIHASTTGMIVRTDTALGKWSHWGMLRDVAYTDKAPDGKGTPPKVSKGRPESPLVASAEAKSSAPLAAAEMPTIRFGSRSDAVVRLQLILRAIGYELEPDGIFGAMTREAVKTYQATHGLAADGVVGPMTWAELM